MLKPRAALIPLLIAVAAAANAQYTSYSLSGVANYDAQSLTGGNNYPAAGQSFDVNGVPLEFTSGGGYQTGIISLGYNNSTSNSTLNIGQNGVKTVYTFINSVHGLYGATIGTVTFAGSNFSQTFNLTEGNNVRDQYDGFYNNVAPNVAGTQYFASGTEAAYSPDRVDMQAFSLDANIGTLEAISFHSYNTGEGDPLIFGVTTSAAVTPEPSSMIASALGLGGFFLLGRKRRSQV